MLPISMTLFLACWIPLAGLVLALCIGPDGEEDYLASDEPRPRGN